MARTSCSTPVVATGTATVPCSEDGSGGVSAGAGRATAPGVAACPGTAQVTRPYFQKADWLWDPIPADPELDPQSGAMAKALSSGDHILNTGEFGVTLVDPEDIPADAPRSAVPLSENWGPDPLEGITVPVPSDLEIPPGSDGHVAIADASTNTVVNMWVTKKSGNGLKAAWGAATPLDGDGRETNGSSTGAGIARYAAVVRAQEIADQHIPHALFFSTNVVKPKEVRYPATKTDGSNMDGSTAPIPEGARVQLDPSVDVDAIPGISKGEATLAKALQTYGAYVGDNGGARMAFIAEYAPDSKAYADAGLPGDFVALKDIPWDKLRVLSDWSGGTQPAAASTASDPRSDSGSGSGGVEAAADPPSTTQPPASPGDAPATGGAPAAGTCVPGSGANVAPPTVPPTTAPTGSAQAPVGSATAGSAPASSTPADAVPAGQPPTAPGESSAAGGAATGTPAGAPPTGSPTPAGSPSPAGPSTPAGRTAPAGPTAAG